MACVWCLAKQRAGWEHRFFQVPIWVALFKLITLNFSDRQATFFEYSSIYRLTRMIALEIYCMHIFAALFYCYNNIFGEFSVGMFWKTYINSNGQPLELISFSLLLYTFQGSDQTGVGIEWKTNFIENRRKYH